MNNVRHIVRAGFIAALVVSGCQGRPGETSNGASGSAGAAVPVPAVDTPDTGDCPVPKINPATGEVVRSVALIVGPADATAELADSPRLREVGLMHRTCLPVDHGMLFVYSDEGIRQFWMRNTNIALDIAFMDSAGEIGKVLSMEPCESELYAAACPTYAPGVDYWSALEVNRGWFAEHNVGEGDTVRVEP